MKEILIAAKNLKIGGIEKSQEVQKRKRYKLALGKWYNKNIEKERGTKND